MEVKNKEMARVAVIILNWNGEKLLREFLPSVVKYTDPGLGRIVVADNASEDDSVRILEQEFPEVELIRFSQIMDLQVDTTGLSVWYGGDRCIAE